MRLLERRHVIVLATASFGYQTPPTSSCVPLAKAVELIQQQCPPTFRTAVQQSGHFLYRGESVTEPCILNPPSDLLDPSTYGSNDSAAALSFFQCLQDRYATARLRPSTGHLGTARRVEAATWGPPCTVWPLGQPFHYQWPAQGRLFYPDSTCESAFVTDIGLVEALRNDKEILFRSPSFLVVPAIYEEALRAIILP